MGEAEEEGKRGGGSGYQEDDRMEEKGSNKLLPAAGRKRYREMGGRIEDRDVGRKMTHQITSCSCA